MSDAGAAETAPPAQEAPSAARERVPEYDIARWIAIAAVVLVHASSFAVGRDSVTFLGLLNRVARFGVPAFLLVAAALAWGTRAPLGLAEWRRFVARRAVLVWLPYSVWTLVYLMPDLLRAPGVWSGIGRVGVALLTGNAAPHLYFVPLVTAVWLLAPIAGRVVRRAPGVAFVAGTVLSLILRFWVLDGGLARTTVFGLVLYLPAVLAGAWYDLRLPRSREVLRRWWPAFAVVGVAGAGLDAAGLFYWPLRWVAARLGWVRQQTQGLEAAAESVAHVATVAGLLGFSAWLSAWRERTADLATRTAPLVFGVYLTHALPVFGTLVVVRRFAPAYVASPVLVAAVAVGGLVVSYWMTALLAASRYTCWSVGVKQPWPLRDRRPA